MAAPLQHGALSEERRGAIIRLLEALDDGLPEPAVQPLSQLGFVHHSLERVSCPDCLANDRPAGMPGCETCGGRGYLEERRSRDPYDTGANRGWMGAARHEAAKERDREIARLEAQTEPPRPEAEQLADTRPAGWELERRRLRGQFDIDACVLALDVLHRVDEDACRALHAVHVYGWMDAVSPAAGQLVERGLLLLHVQLPDPLRAPPPPPSERRGQVGVRARNVEVRRAAKQDGATSQWLAREHGLSVSQVNRILAGDDNPI